MSTVIAQIIVAAVAVEHLRFLTGDGYLSALVALEGVVGVDAGKGGHQGHLVLVRAQPLSYGKGTSCFFRTGMDGYRWRIW